MRTGRYIPRSSTSLSFEPSPFFQPKLSVNQPNDVYENEAEETAERVVNKSDPSPKKTFFSSPSTVPVIQRQADKTTTTSDKPEVKKEEEAGIGFIDMDSFKKAIKEIFGKLPERYKEAYRGYEGSHSIFIFDLSESRTLASKEIMGLWNLSNALVYRSYTKYKDVGFGDSVKIMESLSGVSDTYISLASLLLQKDLDKYISDEVPALVKKNLGIILLAGLLIQGGVTAVQYATSSEANFTSLINPVLSGFTAPPIGFTNPLQLDNIADPRWKSPFLTPDTGPDAGYTRNTKDPKVSPALTLNLGLNIASFGDLYPKTEEDKKKYKGLEFYPFFNFTRSYAQQASTGTEKQDKYFVGFFAGDKGVYTLMEAGVIKGPLGYIETYGKGGLIFRNFGPLQLLRIDAEADQKGSDVRGRLNAATQIQLVNNERWQFAIGGMVGGLLPGADQPGAVDYGGSLSLYHKEYSGDKKDMYRTGGELGFTSRLQDPFDAASQQLFTFRAGLTFKGFFYNWVYNMTRYPVLDRQIHFPQYRRRLHCRKITLPVL